MKNKSANKISIKLPIREIIVNSFNYKLIIIDNDGISHYFNRDNSYDGYSKMTVIPIEYSPN